PGDLNPLFEEILRTVPEPKGDPNAPFKMMVSNLDFDSYKGTFAMGRILQGTIKPGQSVSQVEHTRVVSQHRVQQVFTSMGLSRVEVPAASAGDIVALTGIDPIEIGNTLTDPNDAVGVPVIRLGEPTLKIYLGPNTSPMAAKEGKFYTA